MKDSMISKAIANGFITFKQVCTSWEEHSGISKGMDVDLLDAVLTVRPDWVDKPYSAFFDSNALTFALSLVKDVSLEKITLLGLTIVYGDSAAEELIRKHYKRLGKSEDAIAEISVDDTSKTISAGLLHELVDISQEKAHTDVLAEKIKHLLLSHGVIVEKSSEDRQYFPPYVMNHLNEIFGYMGSTLWGDGFSSSILSLVNKDAILLNHEAKWCVKEVIGKKAIPYHSRHPHFEAEMMKDSIMQVTADYSPTVDNYRIFTGEKIVIQKRQPEGQWIGEPLELNSLWPDRQIAIGVHSPGNIAYFAPIFQIWKREGKSLSFSEDYKEYQLFCKEMDLYLEERLAHLQKISTANRALRIDLETQACRSFLVWLKDHCS